MDAHSESEQEEEENQREQEEEENLSDADSEWARPDVGVASKEAPAQNRSTEEKAEKATPQPNAKPKPKPQAATKKLIEWKLRRGEEKRVTSVLGQGSTAAQGSAKEDHPE